MKSFCAMGRASVFRLWVYTSPGAEAGRDAV